MIELVALLDGISLLHATFALSYINLVVRTAMESRDHEVFAKLQQKMVAANFDDESRDLLIQRFGATNCDDRPIFLPQCLLNLLRIVLVYGDPALPVVTDDDERIRHLIGRACLMMNDLLVSTSETQALTTSNRDELRIQLMVQSLAGYELANPPKADHLMPRLAVMYFTLLRDPELKARISLQYQGFDFEREFETHVGIPLERWVLVVFGIYAYFLSIGSPLEPNLTYLHINPAIFRGESRISETELAIVLQTVVSSIAEMQSMLKREEVTDPRYDLVPFRSTPLIQLDELKMVPIDLAFILDKCHTGVHWALHDALDIKFRQTLFNVWGMLFEEYVHWLLKGMKTSLPILYVPSPKWRGSHQESFDGLVLKGDVMVAAEYKGGFLSKDARYSGTTTVFLRDLERKFVRGCKQLAEKIGAAFADDDTTRREIEGCDLSKIRAVIPILVLQDHILRVPFLNWYMNSRFQAYLLPYRLRSGVVIRPLTVVNIHELESIVHSTEAEDFDFVYALHHRLVRDEDGSSELLDYLLTVPGFGRKPSPRIAKIVDELFETITVGMFNLPDP